MNELSTFRDISKEVFGRPHQLEVALVVADFREPFQAEQVITEAREHAAGHEIAPPSHSSIRKCLSRLVRLGVVDLVPDPTIGSPDIYSVAESSFWNWIAELSVATADSE